jgi:hypothetical protein
VFSAIEEVTGKNQQHLLSLQKIMQTLLDDSHTSGVIIGFE